MGWDSPYCTDTTTKMSYNQISPQLNLAKIVVLIMLNHLLIKFKKISQVWKIAVTFNLKMLIYLIFWGALAVPRALTIVICPLVLNHLVFTKP